MSTNWMEETAKRYGIKIEKGKRGSIILTFPSENLKLTLTQKKAFKLLMWLSFNTIHPTELKNGWND